MSVYSMEIISKSKEIHFKWCGSDNVTVEYKKYS